MERKEVFVMAVFRVEKTKDFTIMCNHHLRNTELSLKAKGLLSLMLSLPEDWDYTTKGLAHICKDGVDSITTALKELERHGYLNIIPLGSHQFPASEPPGNGIFHLQSHHNILWQHTYLISL